MERDDRRNLEVPVELQVALAAHPELARAFPDFSYAHRREYIRWIAEAKRPETREKRALEAVAMILAKWKP